MKNISQTHSTFDYEISEPLNFDGVIILDGICGSGKTTSIQSFIKQISDFDSTAKFIFVTPYLLEAHRIAGTEPADYNDKDLPPLKDNFGRLQYLKKNSSGKLETDYEKQKLGFKHPENKGFGKFNDTLALMRKGENIVTTHKNFLNWSQDVIAAISKYNYHLIIDETPELVNIVSDYNVLFDEKTSHFDFETYQYLKNLKILEVDPSSKQVKFNTKDKSGETVKLSRYNDVFKICQKGRLFEYSFTSEGVVFINKFDPEIFKSFKSVRLLTYLYEGSVAKAYFDLEGFKQEVIDYTEKKAWEVGLSSMRDLIKIEEFKDEKALLLDDYSLSSSWFSNKKNEETIQALRTIMSNFFKNRVKTLYKERLWTTLVSYKDMLKGEGFSKEETFLPFNSRATNDYRHTNTLAYAINVYMNPIIKNFFLSRGIAINQDMYSTGEMVQWVFRSCIRDDKPIKIFIPSPRMKKLFNNWIEQVEKYSELSKKLEEERENYEGEYATLESLGFTLPEKD